VTADRLWLCAACLCAGDFAVIVKTLQRYPSVDVDHILRAAARLPPCASVLGAPVWGTGLFFQTSLYEGFSLTLRLLLTVCWPVFAGLWHHHTLGFLWFEHCSSWALSRRHNGGKHPHCGVGCTQVFMDSLGVPYAGRRLPRCLQPV